MDAIFARIKCVFSTSSVLVCALGCTGAADAAPPKAPSPAVTATSSLNLFGARAVLRVGLSEIRRRHTTGSIAVVDATGHLVAFARSDGTFIAGDKVSIGKARTSALFRKPTRVFEKIVVEGRLPMLAIRNFMPMQGGLPIVVNGHVVGGVGVSGASSASEDEQIALAAAGAVSASGTAHAYDPTDKPSKRTPNAAQSRLETFSLRRARRVLDVAMSFAIRDNTTGAIAVVDRSGKLVAFGRVDGTFVAGDDVSIGKANTSALFRKPTRVFEDIVVNGRTPMMQIPDFTPMRGGIPIIVDGQIVGAIGVSGASSAGEDEQIAIAGAKAISTEDHAR